MFKKVLLSCLLMATIFTHGGNAESVTYASEICTTEEECEQIIQENQNEIANLEKQEASVQEDINMTETAMADTRERISQTERAIGRLQENITQLQRNISQKESEIRASEAELDRLDTEIEELNELIAGRMRMTQRLSRSNPVLDLLSDSDNFVDFIRRFRVINHLSQSDADMMDQLRDLMDQQQIILATLMEQKAELNLQRAELNSQKEALHTEAANLASYQARLEEQQSQLAQQMHDIRVAMLSAEEAVEIARQQQEIIENTPIPEVTVPSATDAPTPNANVNPETNADANTGTNAGTNNSQVPTPPPVVANQKFIIPLERGRVTCEFTCYPGHTGIDLGNGGDTSTRVLAAAAGVVTRSGWHNMYGNHVIITHNINGQVYTTLYAHLHQTPFVSVGQTVYQGQVLGTMGNTGNSFGAHLHFEIYIGPFNWPHAVNPRQFIHFPSSW